MTPVFHDLRQTNEWANYLRAIGWKIEQLPISNSSITNYLYIKRLPFLPVSVAKLQRPRGEIDWEEVKRLRRKHRIIHLITKDTVANRTIWIDLGKSERQLLLEMKPKTRYNIGLAKRKRVRIKLLNGQQIQQRQLQESLFELLKQNARRLGIFALPKKWYEAQVNAFGKKCFAVLAFYDDQLVAGNFFMTSSSACFYSHNGSTDLGRKLMAPSLCVWEGIREAKRRKLKVFDFDGIYDGSWSLHKWKGFTKFKEGFGGKSIFF